MIDNSLYLELVKAGFARPSHLINDTLTFEQIWKELPDTIDYQDTQYSKVLIRNRQILYFCIGYNISLVYNKIHISILDDLTLTELAAKMWLLLKQNNLLNNN